MRRTFEDRLAGALMGMMVGASAVTIMCVLYLVLPRLWDLNPCLTGGGIITVCMGMYLGWRYL